MLLNLAWIIASAVFAEFPAKSAPPPPITLDVTIKRGTQQVRQRFSLEEEREFHFSGPVGGDGGLNGMMTFDAMLGPGGDLQYRTEFKQRAGQDSARLMVQSEIGLSHDSDQLAAQCDHWDLYLKISGTRGFTDDPFNYIRADLMKPNELTCEVRSRTGTEAMAMSSGVKEGQRYQHVMKVFLTGGYPSAMRTWPPPKPEPTVNVRYQLQTTPPGGKTFQFDKQLKFEIGHDVEIKNADYWIILNAHS
ncbi:MAG: hypothetical protein NTX64_15620 [Elusimicrobia bacterium]|nr:hypothetical protein [Elusimicrobiota bacterium]